MAVRIRRLFEGRKTSVCKSKQLIWTRSFAGPPTSVLSSSTVTARGTLGHLSSCPFTIAFFLASITVWLLKRIRPSSSWLPALIRTRYQVTPVIFFVVLFLTFTDTTGTILGKTCDIDSSLATDHWVRARYAWLCEPASSERSHLLSSKAKTSLTGGCRVVSYPHCSDIQILSNLCFTRSC